MKIRMRDEGGVHVENVSENEIHIGHLCDTTSDKELKRVCAILSEKDRLRLIEEAKELGKSNSSYLNMLHYLK
jgi:hypothetical protein